MSQGILMKFNEAMDKLQSGSKVTRPIWKDCVYFIMQDNEVKSFQPKLTHYIYNEDIMISEGWLVDDIEGEMRFCDIIPHLKKGRKARMKNWDYSFIFFDPQMQDILIQTLEVSPFTPEFQSFLAEDWMVIE